MNFFLFILAFTLVLVFAPVGLLFTTIKSLLKNNTRFVSTYYKNLALSLDQLGNVVMSDFFNAVLIQENGYKFGNPDETISSVLGKNKKKATFKLLGYCLDDILNRIDHNHTIKSIEDEEIF